MGSKSFQLNQKDIGEVLKIMAAAGVSAALVAGLQTLGTVDLGPMGPFLTAGLTALIKFVQQWTGDNSQTKAKS
jgi:hypothetical protein